MIGYLKKVFLDILPPVTATVIGAYIVTNYVAPRQQADAPKVETAAPAAEKLVHGADGMAPRDVETVAVKPQDTAKAKQAAKDAKDTKSQEAKSQEAKSRDAKSQAAKQQDTQQQDTKRPQAAKLENAQAAQSQPDQSQPIEAKAASVGLDEKRDAAEMARAALDRLRGNQIPPTHTTAAPQAPAPQQAAQAAAVIPTAVPAAPAVIPAAPATASAAPSTSAPALAPPVVIIPQREERSVFGERMSPPAEIPGGRAMASSEDRSLLGGIAGAAKSLVDVVIPR